MAFPTTRWSLLAQATIHGDAAQREALGEFYRRYREPIVGFIRRQAPAGEPAEDVAQEFFVHLIENATLQRADRLRGRFRSFLLGALSRFLTRRRTRDHALKRGGSEPALPLDSLAADADQPATPSTVARAFDREWAHLLLGRARARIRAGWHGAAQELALLECFLPGASGPLAYEAAAGELGWPLARLKTEVHRLRRRFREQVRAEIALTVNEPHEVDEELAHLHRVLAESPD